MLVLPDLSVTIWFGRRCCPLTRERCRVQPSHTGGCGTGVVPAYCDHGTPGGGGCWTQRFPWEKVAQPWQGTVLFPTELPARGALHRQNFFLPQHPRLQTLNFLVKVV